MNHWLGKKMDSDAIHKLIFILACPLLFNTCLRPDEPDLKQPPFSLNSLNTPPLSRGHAHNDYQHPAPLYDALRHHFNSVEADIYYLDGEFYVAHYLWEIRRERTLKNLYLEPLRKLIKENNGQVYGDNSPFYVFVDIKLGAESTYRALRQLLREYQELFTSFSDHRIKKGAITIIITGNRPIEMMARETTRFAALDGRIEDLDLNLPPTLMPFISERWSKHFSWRGRGPISMTELRKLRNIVRRAHQSGRMVRFWATPDSATLYRERLWHFLLGNGVDWLNTDDLQGMQRFLTTFNRETTIDIPVIQHDSINFQLTNYQSDRLNDYSDISVN